LILAKTTYTSKGDHRWLMHSCHSKETAMPDKVKQG
jgi:hypothetical protein